VGAPSAILFRHLMCFRRLRIPAWNWQFDDCSDFQPEAERLVLVHALEQTLHCFRGIQGAAQVPLAMRRISSQSMTRIHMQLSRIYEHAKGCIGSVDDRTQRHCRILNGCGRLNTYMLVLSCVIKFVNGLLLFGSADGDSHDPLAPAEYAHEHFFYYRQNPSETDPSQEVDSEK
jgi:hypothetical protein